MVTLTKFWEWIVLTAASLNILMAFSKICELVFADLWLSPTPQAGLHARVLYILPTRQWKSLNQADNYVAAVYILGSCHGSA